VPCARLSWPFCQLFCAHTYRIVSCRIAWTYFLHLSLSSVVFTKRLTGMRSLSYESRLKALGLERLELRRLRMDRIPCYNIVHGGVSIPFDSFFEFSAHGSTRGNPLKKLLKRVYFSYAIFRNA